MGSDRYSEAGVNLEAGYESVRRIRPLVESTAIPGVMGSVGGFGGLFDLSVYNFREPVLVSGTDGVGTKLLIARLMNRLDTIGIDAVAMCVNDILVQGALPLFFLDYLAVAGNVPSEIADLVAGVAEGCRQAECALIGGETAEMPGVYAPGHFDIAGFAVGACEKSELLSASSVRSGSVLIGLPSSGCHSNGYSLIRKIVADNGLDYARKYAGLELTLGEELLRPTTIYVKAVKPLLLNAALRPALLGMAHITGGGFIENVPRMLPPGQVAVIDMTAFTIPPIFRFLMERGALSVLEAANVFNLGIGLVLAVDPDASDAVLADLRERVPGAVVLGYVAATADPEAEPSVVLQNLDAAATYDPADEAPAPSVAPHDPADEAK
ncbi:MAG: phosphoribosylformylglycinamidine cyclo-ligase [Clostridiaceae bacterium]|nr:phosphoribosylformylglycinamidine cyclo-ligase [Clostridiaceae bacterium]